MSRIRPRSPIIPGDTTDRTGSGPVQRRAIRAIRQRWAGLAAEVLAIFARIRVVGEVAQNDQSTQPRTVYALTPEELAAVTQALREAFDRWIEAVAGGSYRTHWYAQIDAEAAQLGLAQSAANLSALSATYAASRDIGSALMSQGFQNRVAMAQIKSYEHWTGLSAGEKSALSQIIGRGVVDGKNPRVVAKEIAERMGVSRARAEQYAQTDITDTLRMTRLDERDWAVENLGMEIGLLWKSALIPTTRPTHAVRNGRTYSSAEVRDFYSRDGNIYRCFLPGTRVAGRFSAGIQSYYKGPAVRLVTAAGHELAVTANHPVLTARGMVPAAELREGDHLVAYRGQVEGLAARVRQLHGQLVMPRVEDVFRALVDAGGHQSTARVSPVDLHGDAAFVDPQVHVVRADRELVFGMDADAGQLLDQLALVCPDTTAARRRALDLLAHRDVAHPGGSVGASDMRAAGVGVEPGHPGALPFAAIPPGKPEASEGPDDGAAANAGALADRQQRLPGHVGGVQRLAGLGGLLAVPLQGPEPDAVERLHDGAITGPDAVGDVLQRFAGLAAFDQVVDVVVSHYEGHVFDLQERSGLMLGSNIVASNCHCSVTEVLLDDEGRPMLTDRAKETSRTELARWQAQQKKTARK